jgi:hypothetical protein
MWLLAISYQLSAISYQLLAVSFQLSGIKSPPGYSATFKVINYSLITVADRKKNNY